MKKTFVMASLLVAVSVFGINSAIAHPEGNNIARVQHPPIQEKIQRPDFAEILLSDKTLNLTEQQKKDIKKTSEKTHKKVRKLDKKARKLDNKIRETRDDKLYAIGEHFRKIQEILTDEQKEQLYNEHQKRVEERFAKFREMQEKRALEKPKCNCGNECKCGVHKQPIKKYPHKKHHVQQKPQPVKK